MSLLIHAYTQQGLLDVRIINISSKRIENIPFLFFDLHHGAKKFKQIFINKHLFRFL